MTSREQLERQRERALELLRTARSGLQPTSRSRFFGVTSRMLDRAYEKEKAAIEELYEVRIAEAGKSAEPAELTMSGTILTFEQLAEKVAGYRARGSKMVLTNGCFDLLHRGHIGYLAEARKLGDVLILGLNSDESVHRLKGAGRPVLGVADRAEILSALRTVDHVVVFDGDTAEALVDVVQPHVYVKGGDYSPEFPTPEAVRAKQYGAEYHVVSYVEGTSTTQLIERIAQSRR